MKLVPGKYTQDYFPKKPRSKKKRIKNKYTKLCYKIAAIIYADRDKYIKPLMG